MTAAAPVEERVDQHRSYRDAAALDLLLFSLLLVWWRTSTYDGDALMLQLVGGGERPQH